jgi:hypothetical protein
MTTQDFINDMNGVIAVAEQGLATAADLDPALEVPAAIVDTVLPVVEQLVSAALTAWSNASGLPITVETVIMLLPDPTPLTLPPA